MSGMQQRTFAGGVLVPACSPCDEQGAFLEDVYAALLEESLREPLDGAYPVRRPRATACTCAWRSARRPSAPAWRCAARRASARARAGGRAPTMRDALELAAYAAECGADGISSVPLAGLSARRADAVLPRAHQGRRRAARHPLLHAAAGRVVHAGARCSKRSPSRAWPASSARRTTCSSPNSSRRRSRPAPCSSTARMNTSAPAVIHGAEGGIGMWATVFPRAYVAIFRYARAGKLAEAFALQRVLNALCCRVLRYGLLSGYAAIRHYLGPARARVPRAAAAVRPGHLRRLHPGGRAADRPAARLPLPARTERRTTHEPDPRQPISRCSRSRWAP